MNTNDLLLDFERYTATLTNEQLGRLVREYVQESQHQGWDGFSPPDLQGAAELLSDVKRFGESDGFDKIPDAPHKK